MKYNSCYGILALTTAVLLYGCNDQALSPLPGQAQAPRLQDRLKDAHALLATANEARVRGEQDEMLRVETKIPGFGGFFRDNTGQVVVYLKRGSPASHAALRNALHSAYSIRTEPLVREAMATAINAQIIEGDYALSELIAYENRINYSDTPIPGYAAAGVSLRKNRVVLALESSGDIQPAQREIMALGIPVEALKIEVWGKGRATSTWASDVRPVAGGLQIGIYNRTTVPWPTNWTVFSGGSVGFNVRTASGGVYLLTASHIANTLNGINGAILDTITQAWPKQRTPGSSVWTPKPVARFWVNPPWTAGSSACGAAGVDYCTEADAALAIYLPGITSDLKIGTSVTEGLNGNRGDDQINGFYPIQGVLPPELVKGDSLGIHKSGSRTGTTTGVILDEPLLTANFGLCWGVNATLPPAPPGCRASKVGRWIDATMIRGMTSDGGDSGGAVFAGNGSPYSALGIVIGSFGQRDANGNCIEADKMICITIFHKWSAIENKIGWGSLSPITVP